MGHGPAHHDWKDYKELETGGIIRENLFAAEGDMVQFLDRDHDIYYGPYHVHPEHGPLEGATWQGPESLDGPLWPQPIKYDTGPTWLRTALREMLLKDYPELPVGGQAGGPQWLLPSEILNGVHNSESPLGLQDQINQGLIVIPPYTNRNDKGVLILDENVPTAITGYDLGLTVLRDGVVTDEILDREFDYFEAEPGPEDSDTLQDSNLFYTTAFEGDWHEIWMRQDLNPGDDGYTEMAADFECFYVEDGVYRNIPDYKTLEVMLAERNMTYDNVIKLGKRSEIDQEWKNGNGMVASRATEWSDYTKANAGYEPVTPFTRDPADYAVYDNFGNFTGEFLDNAFNSGQTYLEKQRVRYEGMMINPNGDEGNIRIMLKGVWRKLPTDGTEQNDNGANSGDDEAKAIIEMYVADKWPDYLKYDKKKSSYGLINTDQDEGGLRDSPVFHFLNTQWSARNYGPEGVRIWNDFDHRQDFLTIDQYQEYLEKYNDIWNQQHLIAAGEPPGSIKYYKLAEDELDVTAPLARLPDSETGAGFSTLITEETNTWAQGIQDYVTVRQQELTAYYTEVEGLYSLALNVLGTEDEPRAHGKLRAYVNKTNFRFGKKKRRKKFGYEWPSASNYKKWRVRGNAKEVIDKAYKKEGKSEWGDGRKGKLKTHFKTGDAHSFGKLQEYAKAQMEDVRYAYEAAQELYTDGQLEIAEWLSNFQETYLEAIENFTTNDQAEEYYGDTFSAAEEITNDWIDGLKGTKQDMRNQIKQYFEYDDELFNDAEKAMTDLASGAHNNWQDRYRIRDYWLGSGKNNPDNPVNNDTAIDPSTVSRPEFKAEFEFTPPTSRNESPVTQQLSRYEELRSKSGL